MPLITNNIISVKYPNPGEAIDKPDGLAVLGILVKTGREHPHFNVIAKYVLRTKS